MIPFIWNIQNKQVHTENRLVVVKEEGGVGSDHWMNKEFGDDGNVLELVIVMVSQHGEEYYMSLMVIFMFILP